MKDDMNESTFVPFLFDWSHFKDIRKWVSNLNAAHWDDGIGDTTGLDTVPIP